MFDLVVRGGTVVSGAGTRRADVAVEGGRIAAVGEDIGSARDEIAADGLLVLPGVVDEHVHPIYHDDPRQTSIVGAFGGVTTIMGFAYAHPGASLLGEVQALRDRHEAGSVLDYTIHAGMFDAAEQVAEMPAVAATGVRTFKVFLAYAAQGWMTDDASLVAVLRASRDVGGLVMVHCENGPVIDVLEADARAGRLGDDPVDALLASRPDVLEAEAVQRVAAVAEALDIPVFIVHVTSARALEAVRAARARGQWLIGETCPQYLALTGDAVREFGALAKIGPPLRTAADNAALWEGLADGSLQTVGSDHVPKKLAAERDTPLLDAGFGAPSIETMLPILLDGALAERITLPRLVEVLCENPARAFGLFGRKGVIAPGADADLVLADPAATSTLGVAHEHTNSGYSLYEGREVRGALRLTMAGGRVVVREGVLEDDRPAGTFLPTGPFTDPLYEPAPQPVAVTPR
ncbi:MAG: amidohydrolase family protein [Baekduiaceae bacterium]